MDIKPPATENPQTTLNTSSRATETTSTLLRNLSQTWQIGQIMTAVVTGKSASGTLLLNIQGMEAEVSQPPPLPFQNGQRLELQLLAKQPVPLLNIRNSLLPSQSASVNDPKLINQALRTLVPQQQAQVPLLANIRLLATHPPANLNLPQQVLQLSKQVYQQLPTLNQVRENGGLEKQLKQSGPFLEANLAQLLPTPQQQPDAEIRTTLLRLAVQLQNLQLASGKSHGIEQPATPTPTSVPAQPSIRISTPSVATTTQPHTAYLEHGKAAALMPPTQGNVRQTPHPQPQSVATLLTIASQENGIEELLRQVEGTLARVQVQQMQSLHAENQGRTLWAMELPIRTDQGIDLFDFRIERDQQNNSDAQTRGAWTVTLAFDLNGLGPVRAVVAWQNEKITTRFWAEQETTSLLFNQYLDNLRSQLSHVGLNVGRLECRCGTPPMPEINTEPQILDEQA